MIPGNSNRPRAKHFKRARVAIMRVLIIGGSGLISTGIVSHLLARGADVTVFNRGKRPSTLPVSVKHLVGDRNDKSFESFFAGKPFDVVIDMICFNPEQAQADVR